MKMIAILVSVFGLLVITGVTTAALKTEVVNGEVVTYDDFVGPQLAAVPPSVLALTTSAVEFTFITSDGVWSTKPAVAVSIYYGNFFQVNPTGSFRLENTATNLLTPDWKGFVPGEYLGTTYYTNQSLTHFVNHVTNSALHRAYRLTTSVAPQPTGRK